MKKFNKNSIGTAFVASVIIGFALPIAAFAATATASSLGTAASFSVMAGSSMTADGSGATISGDLGISPGSTKNGTWTHTGGSDFFAGAAAGAMADAVTAWNNMSAANQPGGTTWSLNPTPAAGLWVAASSATFSGTLTLNGSATDVWIFQITDSLTFTGTVNLTGGAQACNVYWRVAQDATINSGGAGSKFVGTLIAGNAVSLVGGATVDGRMIARNAALTTAGVTSITGPTCAPATATLTVTKTVNNTHGGTKVVANFPLFVDGMSVTSGVASTTGVGLHTISETADAGYTSVIGGDCAANGTITLSAGQNATCTITNTDTAGSSQQPSTVNVVKIVVNDGGGTKTIADFPLFVNGTSVVSGVTNTFPAIGGVYSVTEANSANYTHVFSGDCDVNGQFNLTQGQNKFCIITNNDIAAPVVPPVPPLIDVVKVPSPLALPNGPGPVTYAYTLRNVGTVPVTNVTMVGDTCSPIVLSSGDIGNDAKLDVNETWVYHCTTTLAATHTNTVVTTGWANGISAVDVTSATVVVGAPAVPPLIHVTKVPSPFALAVGGGRVMYSYTVTNPGVTPLANVNISDDKCAQISGPFGDTNGNNLLDQSETWAYACQTNLAKTTTNTVIVSGEANGLVARDFAIVTVVVASPGLPQTGFPPRETGAPWSVVLLSGIAILSFFLSIVQKKEPRS